MQIRTTTLLALLALTGVALASPPPPPEDDEPARRPPIEWSTWFRAAMGMRPRTVTDTARATMPPPERRGQDTAYELAAGADATLGAARHDDLRIGPWFEIRGYTDWVAGGELVLERFPKTIDMFAYDGQGVLALRAGANSQHVTAQLAYGYLAPWDLFHEQHGESRYMIGVRFVATYTRGIVDRSDWVATFGLETEPVGALRYLLGIRSWY